MTMVLIFVKSFSSEVCNLELKVTTFLGKAESSTVLNHYNSVLFTTGNAKIIKIVFMKTNSFMKGTKVFQIV